MTTAYTSIFLKACQNYLTHGDRLQIQNAQDVMVGSEGFKALRRRDSTGRWTAEVPGLMVTAWSLTRTTFERAETVIAVVIRHKSGTGAEAVAQGENIIGKATRQQGITIRKGRMEERKDDT